MLELDDLKKIFKVDCDTGEIYWRVDVGRRGKKGSVAGTIKLNGKTRYLKVVYDGVAYGKHHLVWLFHHGEWAPLELDHIDGNRENNSILNLRCVGQLENNRNAKNRNDNKTGIRGVQWNPNKKRYIANIGINKKWKQLGSFTDFFEACCVRKSAERKYGYHLNHGRTQ